VRQAFTGIFKCRVLRPNGKLAASDPSLPRQDQAEPFKTITRKFIMSDDINEQEIREYAYRLWQEAGSPEGQETEFWQQAKDLIAERYGNADVDAASEESFPASDPVNHM
jgi:hypothetical protein